MRWLLVLCLLSGCSLINGDAARKEYEGTRFAEQIMDRMVVPGMTIEEAQVAWGTTFREWGHGLYVSQQGRFTYVFRVRSQIIIDIQRYETGGRSAY